MADRNVDKIRRAVKGKGSNPNSRKQLALKKGGDKTAKAFSTWSWLQTLDAMPRRRTGN